MFGNGRLGVFRRFCNVMAFFRADHPICLFFMIGVWERMSPLRDLELGLRLGRVLSLQQVENRAGSGTEFSCTYGIFRLYNIEN